jgi:hypothetical protein
LVASSTKSQLGFDETVRHSLDEETQQPVLDFTVNESIYRTVGSPIFSDSISGPTGRVVRVFKVKELVDGRKVGDELALKDFWLRSDAKSERQIRQDIWEELERLDGLEEQKNGMQSGYREELESLMLTIHNDQDITQPGASTLDRCFDCPVGAAPLYQVAENEGICVGPSRRHRREVIELGTTLFELDDFKTLNCCLNDVTRGMFLILSQSCFPFSLANHVQRSISFVWLDMFIEM